MPRQLLLNFTNINGNQLTKFSWESSPQGLEEIDLSGNNLTEFSLENINIATIN
jgi:Leucine-rich repeat (LRR) protein